jgi:hypothetical protein
MNSGQNVCNYPVSRVETLEREVFPNLVKVCKGFRVDAGVMRTLPPRSRNLSLSYMENECYTFHNGK